MDVPTPTVAVVVPTAWVVVGVALAPIVPVARAVVVADTAIVAVDVPTPIVTVGIAVEVALLIAVTATVGVVPTMYRHPLRRKT